MLRTIFTLGLFALLGMFALSLIFNLFGGLIGLAFGLVGFAVKILIWGLLIYVVIRIFSPDTARKLREKWSGNSM